MANFLGINGCPLCGFEKVMFGKDSLYCNNGHCNFILNKKGNESNTELITKWNKLGTLDIKSKSQARRLSAQL